MGLFSKKNKEFSGSPTSGDEEDGHNKLHKKHGSNGLTDNTASLDTAEGYRPDGSRISTDQNATGYNAPGVRSGQTMGGTGAGVGSGMGTTGAGTAAGAGAVGSGRQMGMQSNQPAAYNQGQPGNGVAGGMGTTGAVGSGRQMGMQSNQPVNAAGYNQGQAGGYANKGVQQQGFGQENLEGAHAKVRAAQEAEERALGLVAAARIAVKEAKEMVGRLSAQAEEEARLAAIKQKEAMGLTQDTQGLGRV